MKNIFRTIFFLSFFFFFAIRCNEQYLQENIPIVKTHEAENITQTTALCGGEISSDGGASVTDKGICWSTAPNPTLADNTTNEGTGTGIFSSSITGLTANTTYYARAYATNIIGTAYGNEISFSTSESIILPTVSTYEAINISQTSARSGGNVSSDGGASVTDKGICWSTSPNPTLMDNKITEGEGSGSFESTITGLTANTTYYVRAYATNIIGTAYGNEINYTTPKAYTYGSVSDIEGNTYKTVIVGEQTWMAENLKTTKYNDGTQIDTSWGTTPSYGWYNNDINNKNIYGALYNWFAVDSLSNSNKNICPTGWHIPSIGEWTILTVALGGREIAGAAIKESGTTHWSDPNIGATNSSGFTALPAGIRYPDGSFNYLGGNGYFWSSTQYYTYSYAHYIYVNYAYTDLFIDMHNELLGFSVRCVKD